MPNTRRSPAETTPSEEVAQRREAVLAWIARNDRIAHLCYVKGHWWGSDDDDGVETAEDTLLRVRYIREPCVRGLNGQPGDGCGVIRTRYEHLDTGVLVKSSSYDYRNARNYQMGTLPGGGFFLNKAERGLIRLAVRAEAGGEPFIPGSLIGASR